MYIKSFEEISRKEVETVGGKGANLGEMVRVGINVPAGGVLTIQAYERFMEWNHLRANQEPGKKAPGSHSCRRDAGGCAKRNSRFL